MNLEIQWETYFTDTHLTFLRGEKNNLEHQKRLWGKWVGINVNKTSGFLVILRKEILWKFIFSLKSKLLCYILLSAVHFTIQGSTRIDCDLFFYFWIGTTRNKIPVRQLAFTSQQRQWSMPHAKSKPVWVPPSKTGHCHSHLAVCYKQKKL